MGITFHTMLRHLMGHRSAIRRNYYLLHSYNAVSLKNATIVNSLFALHVAFSFVTYTCYYLPCANLKNLSLKSTIRISNNKKFFLCNIALVQELNKELTPTDLYILNIHQFFKEKYSNENLWKI